MGIRNYVEQNADAEEGPSCNCRSGPSRTTFCCYPTEQPGGDNVADNANTCYCQLEVAVSGFDGCNVFLVDVYECGQMQSKPYFGCVDTSVPHVRGSHGGIVGDVWHR